MKRNLKLYRNGKIKEMHGYFLPYMGVSEVAKQVLVNRFI